MNLRKVLREQLITAAKEYCKNIKNHPNGEKFNFENITLDYTPNLTLGHYASNIAMLLSRPLKKKPTELSEELKKVWADIPMFAFYISKVSIAGPGFLNFFLRPKVFHHFFQKNFFLDEWLDSSFTVKQQNSPDKIHFEFVSANPTGPLNIVSARAAAVGDSICRVLKRTKKDVFKEYYVNDFGNQVHLLGVSFAVRYLESQGISMDIPENGYHGEYVKDILEKILQSHELPEALKNIHALKNTKNSQNELEAWCERAASFFSPQAVQFLLESHKKDLKEFRVRFDSFFSERSLHEQDKIKKCFQTISEKEFVYEKDGAFFFKSTGFGDDKDRVLRKKDGSPTYFLSDIAYHLDKFERGYSRVYDIWGPDHHGYIARLKGALKAIKKAVKRRHDSHQLNVLIVQQVNLIEQGKAVVMSKRLGKFQSMRDLLNKIPVDVSRYFFVSRSQNQHLNFDLELALDQSSKNPVYYIQYAYARVHSIFREYSEKILKEEGRFNHPNESIHISLDTTQMENGVEKYLEDWLLKPEREELLFTLMKFVDELEMVSENLEVHKLASYLYNLAHCFTKFYHEKENRIIRLMSSLQENSYFEGVILLRICQITAMVIQEGLSLLGISAPKKM